MAQRLGSKLLDFRCSVAGEHSSPLHPWYSTKAHKFAARRRANARDRVPIAGRTIHSVAARPREERKAAPPVADEAA